ncbi:MAG: cryptochrome/photolyase family protein [Desulfobacteraceae bacterium]|nr:cryptochrome/photolyase family protein [Desulfobacteraceae bacterium]
MTHPKILRLILGDQLNEHHSWFQKIHDNVTYLLMEIRQETDYVKHHVQKVASFFAAMRAFSRRLIQLGHRLIYIPMDDPSNAQNFEYNLKQLILKEKFTHFEYLLPDEVRLDEELKTIAGKLGIPHQVQDTEHFLTQRQDVKEFFKDKKQYIMESFYRFMRKKHNILMDGNKPVGGKWNFDQSNRRRYDTRVSIPKPITFSNNVADINEMIEKAKIKTFGDILPEQLIWPVNRSQAIASLNDFLTNRLPHFGTYQDAMTRQSWSVFHSRLSFVLNTKILHPMEVIQAAIDTWKENKELIGIQQIEGFIRQILGWREYMRGMYWALMPEFADMNFFNHTEPLPRYYWDGRTKMACMNTVIGQSLKYAYAHHIQRLMITGNFALLAGVQPDEVDTWYLGIYIDAIQWVEITNTRGMSQYADGGIIATKPYVSSANYINSMSDYCQDCHYDYRARYGQRACPFNSFYWDFLARHRHKLERNPRVTMMYRAWDRKDDIEKEKILKQAKTYKNILNDL